MQVVLLTLDIICVVLVTGIYVTMPTINMVKKELNKHRTLTDQLK